VRADAALADRNASVRGAARSWRKAEAIDDAALAGVEKLFPDDRARVGPVFRVLLFLFTVLAANALFGFVWLLFFEGGDTQDTTLVASTIVYGVMLAVLTEFQIGRLKRSQGGTEAATSFVALGYLLGGLGWFALKVLDQSDVNALSVLLVEAALLFAVAAWRWGYPVYAGAAIAALLGAVAHLPFGRVFWIVLPLLAAPFLLRLADSVRLPPAHRNSCEAVLFVSLAGLYVAVHLGSFESGLIEEIGNFGRRAGGPASTSDVLWWLSATATILVPLILLAVTVRTRRYPFLILGLGTAAASCVTLRYYVHLGPLWAVLIGSGIALVAGVFALRRYLDSGPEKERAGFTAAPLFEDLAQQRLLEIGAAVASLTPAARAIHEEPRYSGGGGEFGGGGSTGEF
jgi:MFS family permease